eukprot:gnl/TRDRNA2_/TRDRNA2_182880_c0_seq1.p1 gnl/TRDRNA2_/TRDRNA2_182880_c0~~gnl/TRDRNA2_/TRDRNA2_182880_c0_seq1.p1  ORF type:complete len:450 (+),score=83.00 gnl/TRDRNA2_/TRDRNA2_182880_c0_seq1:100-1449(+)
MIRSIAVATWVFWAAATFEGLDCAAEFDLAAPTETCAEDDLVALLQIRSQRLVLEAKPPGSQPTAAAPSAELPSWGAAKQANFLESGCVPSCTWKCEDVTCDQVCEPICQPPACETRCMMPDLSVCHMECEKPHCAVVCPQRNCSSTECPPCSTTCSEPRCELKCPKTQLCRHVCEQPKCEWRCRAPAACPKPKCQLDCETSKACEGSTFHELPPLQPGELSVSAFSAPSELKAPGSRLAVPVIQRSVASHDVASHDVSLHDMVSHDVAPALPTAAAQEHTGAAPADGVRPTSARYLENSTRVQQQRGQHEQQLLEEQLQQQQHEQGSSSLSHPQQQQQRIERRVATVLGLSSVAAQRPASMPKQDGNSVIDEALEHIENAFSGVDNKVGSQQSALHAPPTGGMTSLQLIEAATSEPQQNQQGVELPRQVAEDVAPLGLDVAAMPLQET